MIDQIINDAIQLLKHILDYLSDINFLLFITIVFFHFLYQLKEDNFERFPNILLRLVSPKYLYRYLRYSIIAVMVLLILNHLNYIYLVRSYNSYKFPDLLYKNVLLNLPQYLFLLLVTYYIIFRTFKFRITRYLVGVTDSRFKKYKFVFFKFFLFCITSFGIQFLMLLIATLIIKGVDSLLLRNGYYPIDLINDLSIELSYYRGVYISVILSILLVFALFNAIVKGLNRRYTLQDFLMYLFILIILGVASYSGFYSIFNFIFNVQLYGFRSDWLNSDKLLGNFSVRITSLLLLWSVLKFFYKSIFKRQFLSHLIYALLPIEPNDNHNKKLGQFTGYGYDYFDSIYFAQVGFYALNVFTAEFLISNINIDFYTSILFLLLPIMVDDFFVIHVYHKQFNHINEWHRIKVYGFNILLTISSILVLLVDSHFIVLTIYILSSLLFLYIGFIRHRN